MPGRIRASLSEGYRLAAHSLAGRLLLLTVFYVMIGEVLIFVPSIGQYYRELLGNHTDAAELAFLPFTLPGGSELPEAMRTAILKRAGAQAVFLTLPDQRLYFDLGRQPTKVDVAIDLNKMGFGREMVEALSCLFHRGDRILHVTAPTRIQSARSIGIILSEQPIRTALVAFAWRVLMTGLFVSAVAALLLFLSLFFVFVRPMERFSAAMIRFRDNPEDSGAIVSPSGRRDEIGTAERELAAMQRDLYASLQQKTRLAALGTAVARIQHDLRNILSNAQLASERLSAVEDPVVKRLTPRLVASLDRAVALATQTLRYGRADERPPARRRIPFKPLVDDAAQAALEIAATPIAFVNAAQPGLEIDADPEQLYRIVLNLLRNAVEALAGRGGARIDIVAERHGRCVSFSVADNGPGIPDPMRARLFQPFARAARTGGSGLGLAIARDLVRAHGGDIALLHTGADGTRFRIDIPDRKDAA
ncbi:MAG: HAMP domain-containing histidine kinase [Alphaproteobacteria bacterium]|nr:HAMP domain-containing histidine kinase [Alphaproteobacteria bacterium]MBV9692561.1 HAMP domain-containing histidine kinase [Alphaproteobacteria bacterium]